MYTLTDRAKAHVKGGEGEEGRASRLCFARRPLTPEWLVNVAGCTEQVVAAEVVLGGNCGSDNSTQQ